MQYFLILNYFYKRNYVYIKGEDLDTMSTRRVWKQSEIKTNPLFSKMRSTIETAFYGNNVTPITSVAQAYQLATEEPGVIVLDMSVI